MALLLLETIVHPLVRQAVDILVRRSPHKVIVIEAIKLLESPLRSACDTIWVTYASPVVQINRLMQKRGMSKEAARQRIDAQPPQHEKVAVANTIYLGRATGGEALALIGLQAGWFLVLMMLGRLAAYAGRRKLTIQGG